MKKSIFTLALIAIFAFVLSLGVVGCKKAEKAEDIKVEDKADKDAVKDKEPAKDAAKKAPDTKKK